MVVHAIFLALVTGGRGRKIATIQNQSVLHGKFQHDSVLKQTITEQANKPQYTGMGYSSEVQCLSIMCEALGSISIYTYIKNRKTERLHITTRNK